MAPVLSFFFAYFLPGTSAVMQEYCAPEVGMIDVDFNDMRLFQNANHWQVACKEVYLAGDMVHGGGRVVG